MRIAPLDLANTPGIYYALTYGISALLFVFLNKRRKETVIWTLQFAVIWIMLSLFMLFTYQILPLSLFLPSVLLEFLAVFLMIHAGCDMDLRNCVYFAVNAFILGEFAASLEWQIFYFELVSMELPLRMWLNILTLLIVHVPVFTIIWFLQKPYRDGNRFLTISGRQMITVILTGTVIYALSNISYALKNTPFSSSFVSEIFTIRTLADLGGIAVLFGYHMTLQETQVRREKEKLENVLDLQYKQFQISEQTIDLVNRKYHDLKHQIAYLKSDITEQQKLDFLNEMEAEVKQYEAQNRTGNHVVDTILTEKYLQCQKLNIQMTAVVDGKAMEFLPVTEICSLLGNALDNAIEAVQKVIPEQERLIRFSVNKNKGFLRLRVENRYSGEVKLRDGRPVTSKSNKDFHGFGVKSMQAIADKYDGSLSTEFHDGWFRLNILIPEPAEGAVR